MTKYITLLCRKLFFGEVKQILMFIIGNIFINENFLFVFSCCPDIRYGSLQDVKTIIYIIDGEQQDRAI